VMQPESFLLQKALQPSGGQPVKQVIKINDMLVQRYIPQKSGSTGFGRRAAWFASTTRPPLRSRFDCRAARARSHPRRSKPGRAERETPFALCDKLAGRG